MFDSLNQLTAVVVFTIELRLAEANAILTTTVGCVTHAIVQTGRVQFTFRSWMHKHKNSNGLMFFRYGVKKAEDFILYAYLKHTARTWH